MMKDTKKCLRMLIILILFMGNSTFAFNSSNHNSIQKTELDIKSKERISEKNLFNPDTIFRDSRDNKYLTPSIKRQNLIKQAQRDNPNFLTTNTYKVGDKRNFYVDNGTREIAFKTIEAEAIAVSEHAYYFVETTVIDEEGRTSVTNAINSEKYTFEQEIYPPEYEIFGDMAGNMGNIGDGKLIILHAKLGPGIAGYFWGINEYTQQELDDAGYSEYKSNEWEMIFINEVQDATSTLAHEFQHLIHFNHDNDEARWFDEGCAVFSEYLTDQMPGDYYGVSYWSENYFKDSSDDSLIYWNYYSDGGRDVRIDYGGAYLFVFYLYEQFGIEAIKEFVNSTDYAVVSIDNFVSALDMTFNDVFINWQITLTIDNPYLEDGQYGYSDIVFRINTIDLKYSEGILEKEIPYYGFYTLEVGHSNGKLDIRLENDAQKRLAIIRLHMKSEQLVAYDIIESTEKSLFFEPYPGTGKTILCLAYINENKPTTAGDFGLGPKASVKIITRKHFGLQYTQPEILIDKRNMQISNLSLFFNNLTDIYSDEVQDEVKLIFENEENSQEFILQYNEESKEWGGEFSLKELKGGLYEVKINAETGDFSVSETVLEVEYDPPFPVWGFILIGLGAVSIIGITLIFIRRR